MLRFMKKAGKLLQRVYRLVVFGTKRTPSDEINYHAKIRNRFHPKPSILSSIQVAAIHTLKYSPVARLIINILYKRHFLL